MNWLFTPFHPDLGPVHTCLLPDANWIHFHFSVGSVCVHKGKSQVDYNIVDKSHVQQNSVQLLVRWLDG